MTKENIYLENLFGTLKYQVNSIGVCSEETNINKEHFKVSPRAKKEILETIRLIEGEVSND